MPSRQASSTPAGKPPPSGDGKSSQETSSSSKDKGTGGDKTKDKARSVDRGKSKDKEKPEKKPEPKNAAELREMEEKEYVDGLLTSHGGYLKPILLSLSTSLSLPTRRLSLILGLLYFCLHVIAPPFLLPHLSALVTLIVPFQATLLSIKTELDEKKGPRKARDSPQWSLFWALYGISQFARGWVAIWRPGWKAVFEITRTGCLVAIGGPWFGRAGLKPPGPSDELKKLEKAEEAEKKEAESKKEKEKFKAEKTAKEKKAKAEKKAKEEQGAKGGK